MSNVAKWTDERTEQLVSIVGPIGAEVTKEVVLFAAEALETSVRSVSSKLRKMGYAVASVAESRVSKFDAADTEALRSVVENNPGSYTYATLAAAFLDGKYSAKVIQGKVLSLELTANIKPAEKQEVARTYTEQEEETFLEMAGRGAFLEEIAEATGKTLNSVRGKALSLLRKGQIASIPKQRESHGTGADKDVLEGVDVAKLTVEQIAEATGKTVRGIKTMLTKRGLTATDYDGAAKKAKADERRAA